MIIKQLNYIAAVMRFRSAFHAVNSVVALYNLSKQEWLKCFDPDTETHFIQDLKAVGDGRKADAVVNYTMSLAGVYMKGVGALPGTLSKETLAADNAITVSIMRRMAGMEIKSNEEMFTHVATRLLGIDSALVKAGMTADEVRYTLLVHYLVNLLGEEFSDSSLQHLSSYIAKLGVEERLNDEFFSKMLSYGDEFYAEYADNCSDAIDVIDSIVDRIQSEEAPAGN